MLSGFKRAIACLLLVSIPVSAASKGAPESASSSVPVFDSPSLATRAKDGTISFGKEMGRFYTVVAALQYWECVSTNDPVNCQAFNESMKDINTYIGFGMFVVGARVTGMATQGLPGGRFYSRHLGMVGGMLASDLYGEFANHPLMQELLKKVPKIQNSDERWAKRKEILAKLRDDTVNNAHWWNDRVPQLAGLFGGAFLSGMTIPTTIQGLKGVGAVLEFTNLKTGKAVAYRVTLARHALQNFREAAMFGVRGQINPVAFLALQLVELGAFIKYSEWIESPTKKWWSERSAAKELYQSLYSFEHRFSRMELVEKSFDWEKAVLEVESAWDRFRQSQFHKAKELQQNYAKEASLFESKLSELFYYYQWIASGMSPNSPILANNPLHWEPGSEKEQAEYLQAFFCGVEPQDAILEALDFHGFPMPGRTHDELTPFRAANVSGACGVAPGRAWNSSSRQDIDYFAFHKIRQRLIQQNDYSADVEKAFVQVLPKANEYRMKLIGRYEKRIADALLANLISGRDDSTKEQSDFRVEERRFQRGVLPAYDQEYLYWAEWDEKYGKHTDVFRKAMQRVSMKTREAQKLVDYLQRPETEHRPALDEVIDMKEDSPDWEKVVKEWKSFIIRPISDKAYQSRKPGAPAASEADELGL